MQLFPIGKVYDFMSQRRIFIGVSLFFVISSIFALFKPGPALGTDFVGGTEVEVAFTAGVSPSEIRKAVQAADFSAPEDPMQHTRRLLGLDGVKPGSGRMRLKSIDGEAFVIEDAPLLSENKH